MFELLSRLIKHYMNFYVSFSSQTQSVFDSVIKVYLLDCRHNSTWIVNSWSSLNIGEVVFFKYVCPITYTLPLVQLNDNINTVHRVRFVNKQEPEVVREIGYLELVTRNWNGAATVGNRVKR